MLVGELMEDVNDKNGQLTMAFAFLAKAFAANSFSCPRTDRLVHIAQKNLYHTNLNSSQYSEFSIK